MKKNLLEINKIFFMSSSHKKKFQIVTRNPGLIIFKHLIEILGFLRLIPVFISHIFLEFHKWSSQILVSHI